MVCVLRVIKLSAKTTGARLEKSANEKMDKASHIYKPSELEDLPTLCTGQCCSLKIETPKMRVWLCRVGGGVSIEKYDGRRWEVVAGDCYDTGE